MTDILPIMTANDDWTPVAAPLSHLQIFPLFLGPRRRRTAPSLATSLVVRTGFSCRTHGRPITVWIGRSKWIDGLPSCPLTGLLDHGRSAVCCFAGLGSRSVGTTGFCPAVSFWLWGFASQEIRLGGPGLSVSPCAHGPMMQPTPECGRKKGRRKSMARTFHQALVSYGTRQS